MASGGYGGYSTPPPANYNGHIKWNLPVVNSVQGAAPPMNSINLIPTSVSPGGSCQMVASQVEAAVESQFQQRVMSQKYEKPKKEAAPVKPELPGGGKYDALLEPGQGNALKLYHLMAEIFKADQPPDSGRTNGQSSGKQCAYGGAYPTEAFSPGAVVNLLTDAIGFWPKDSANITLLEPNKRLIIVGDTHGQLEDVLWIFLKNGPPSSENQYLFNGDIADRGSHALEIFLLLFAFKREIPDSVYINRGNHEDMLVCTNYGYHTELGFKFSQHGTIILGIFLHQIFPVLPIATVVKTKQHGNWFVAHGGLPAYPPNMQLATLDEVNAIDRHVATSSGPQTKESHMLFNLLWSDPTDDESKRGDCSHGRGAKYTKADTDAFCKLNKISLVIRSHEVPRNRMGVMQHNARCYTVFSASNYTGNQGNIGGVIIVSAELFSSDLHWAPSLSLLSECMKKDEEQRTLMISEWENSTPLGGLRKPKSNSSSAQAPSNQPSNNVAPHHGEEVMKKNFEQVVQFMRELVVDNEDLLFNAFLEADVTRDGVIPLAEWEKVMLRVLTPVCGDILRPSIAELAKAWKLAERVEYIEFLHRFQIESEGYNAERKTFVECVRAHCLNRSAAEIQFILDPTGTGIVTQEALGNFIQQAGVDIMKITHGVVYSTMCRECNEKPLTTDSALLCFAVIQNRIRPVSTLADSVSQGLRQQKQTLAQLFRIWDKDKSGFVSLSELQQGLLTAFGQQVSNEHVTELVGYIEESGVKNNKIDILEFIGALSPRTFAIRINYAISKEFLLSVFKYREHLRAEFVNSDAASGFITNKVSIDLFRAWMHALNKRLEEQKLRTLSNSEIEFACEFAAKGQPEVHYQRFLSSLRVVDNVAVLQQRRDQIGRRTPAA